MYRKRDGWSDQHSVRVKYDGCVELEVPEKWYKEKGWQPLFDDLPWSDEALRADGGAAADQATAAESTTPDSPAGESASHGNKTESSDTAATTAAPISR